MLLKSCNLLYFLTLLSAVTSHPKYPTLTGSSPHISQSPALESSRSIVAVYPSLVYPPIAYRHPCNGACRGESGKRGYP